MIFRLGLLSLAAATPVWTQQPPLERLRSLAERGDNDSLVAAVRQHPADARELLGRFIAQAGRLRAPAADSVTQVARRVAGAYAAAWNDSFPAINLARFERMSAEQRAAKVVADSVRLAGNAALGTKGVGAAIALWRSALRRSLAVPDSAGGAAALGNIGAGFYEASELDSAESYLRRAQRLAETAGDHRTAFNALGVLGNIAKDRGDLRQAEEMLSRTLEQRTRVGDVRGAVADHTNLGLIAADLNDLAGARAHYGEALALARQHRLDDGAATALLNLGNLAVVEGEFAEAARQYRDALALYRSLENEVDAALVLHNLGLLALRRGDYRSARTQLAAARVVFDQVGTIEDRVQVLRDLATVDAAMGSLQAALGQLRRAEELWLRAPAQQQLTAAVALARADLAVRLNTFAEAERHYARAQASYHRAGDLAGESEAQHGRAMLLVERKQYTAALEQLRLVARRQAALDDRRPAALTQLTIGHAQHLQGRVTDARRTLEQARDTLHALRDAVGEASALTALGGLELDNGAPLAAEAHFRRGLSRLDGRRAPTVSWQLHVGLGQALRGRGALTEAAAELGLAIDDVERMATSLTLDERRSTFLADKWDAYETLARIEHERGDIGAAFAVSERLRARQLRDLLSRGRVTRTVVADSTLIGREQDLRVRIAELTLRLEAEDGGIASTLRGPDLSNGTSGVTREALARVQEQYAQLLLQLRDDGGIVPIVRGDVVHWRVIAGRLRRGQAMLTYLVTDSTTMVFVLTPDTMRVLDLGVGRTELASLVDFARGTMVRRQPQGTPSPWRTPLRRLHQHLIAPIEAAGLLIDMRQLVIVPHAELHYLPFAALMRRGERDEYLIERYDVAYAPSASAWVQLAERGSSSSDRVLALAPRSRELPGSREEMDAIRTVYGPRVTVLTDGAATEQVFRATVERYGIVHLATYGVLNQHNPLFSFVDMSKGGDADGRLEVHEVFGLSLNARLLILSACQTALASGAVSDVPAGDDWVGLVRAFLGAGAEHVIATLWAVEDRSTARVMERLHKRLRAGDAEVVALSQAQRETLRNPATSGPFYWAGFVLVGGR